ncbi:MAG: hypothetical protein WCF65_08315, partial [Parachlamydiaceae bacterium]
TRVPLAGSLHLGVGYKRREKGAKKISLRLTEIEWHSVKRYSRKKTEPPSPLFFALFSLIL